MKKLRLGFVGSGYMGQLAHIACYARIPECELVALAEGRAKTAELVARRYGIAEVYPNHHEMLAKADVDAVVAIMHFTLHHAVVPDILEAGKHLLIEKPLCLGAETGRRLADLARKKKLIFHVGYMKRCDVGVLCALDKIRQWKRSGECGKMNYVRITMPPGNWILEGEKPIATGEDVPQYKGETREPPPEWMDKQTAGIYESFVNFWIHQVNALKYLIEEDYEVVYADPAGATLTAMSASGIPCVIEMAPYGLRDQWDEFYKICFQAGKVEIKTPAPMARQRSSEVRFFYAGDPNRPTEVIGPILPQRWSFMDQARHFVECVLQSKPTCSPASEAVRDLEVAEQYARRLVESRKNLG